MNDPIPFFWNGEYHIFYQHNPNGAYWGDMHWGHAVSQDLRSWRSLPIALTPTPNSYDQDGCFTGCVIRNKDGFQLLYTGIPQLQPLRQVQCLATSRDLTVWTKFLGNPIVTNPPEGFGECFRDPCVWREGDVWRMIIGSEISDKGGAALLYESVDLIEWKYLGPLHVGEKQETGHDFECPDFFEIEGKSILLTSRGKTFWHIGSYEGNRFLPQRTGVTDTGEFYAGKTLVDEKGRRILFGWVTETRPESEQREAGWSGALSLPRELSIQPDGSLGIQPVPELTALRGERRRFENLTLSSASGEDSLLIEGIEGDALEVILHFDISSAREFGAWVLSSPDGEERTEIRYDRKNALFMDSPLPLRRKNDALSLHLFIDRSIVECFANDRASHVIRAYPNREDCLKVGAFVRGGSVKILSIDVWKLNPI
jgi:beta-fructofuranosidase